MNVKEYLARMPKTLSKASANDRKLMELMGRNKSRDLDTFARLPKAKPRRKSQPVEQDLVRATLQALTLAMGIMCWRNSSGSMPVEGPTGRRYIHMSPAGSPDIFGILPGGKMFGLEAKTKSGKQSEKQKLWGTKMNRLGAHYAVFRTVSEAMDNVTGWMNQ